MNNNLENDPTIGSQSVPVNDPVTNNEVSAPDVVQPEPISLGQVNNDVTVETVPQQEPVVTPIATPEQTNNEVQSLGVLPPQTDTSVVAEPISNEPPVQPNPVNVGTGMDNNSVTMPPVVPQPMEVNPEIPEQTTSDDKPKKGKFGLILVIIIVLLIIGAGFYVVLGTDLLRKKAQTTTEKVPTPVVKKFEGIYKNNDDKLYIHNVDDNTIYYNLSGNFNGQAKIDGNIATQIKGITSEEYFEFKLIDSNIEVIYHASDDTEIAAETGTYTRISDYSKENIYKEAVGDSSFLNSKYSGLYTSGDVKIYMIQVSENKVLAKLSNESDLNVFFDEVFEISGDNSLVAKSFFDENENAFEITFADKSFSLTANDEVFGFDEDKKQLELTYTYNKAITLEEILTEFYSDY